MCAKITYGFWKNWSTESCVFRYLVEKVKETGNLIDKPKREKPKTMRTTENIVAVAESVCKAPSTSLHRRSQQLNISKTSLRRILHKDLGITPYKVQLFQELKSVDHPMRFRFAKWTCVRLTEDADFDKKNHLFRWSSFWSWRIWNKQNCRIWRTENPEENTEKRHRNVYQNWYE